MPTRQKNADLKDSRYCISCATTQQKFYKGKRYLLHTLYNLPLEIKIEKNDRLIKEAAKEFGLNHVYISYSGGKGSTVLSHIAKELQMECSILGILTSESKQREQDWIKYGCNVFHKKAENQCRPLSFWSENDILEYINKYNVKISKLYELGYERNGCMYCAFGAHRENTPNRFQRLKITHPIQYTYLVHNFGELLHSFDIDIE